MNNNEKRLEYICSEWAAVLVENIRREEEYKSFELTSKWDKIRATAAKKYPIEESKTIKLKLTISGADILEKIEMLEDLRN